MAQDGNGKDGGKEPALDSRLFCVERELKLLTKDGRPDPFYVGVTPFLFKHRMLIHSAPSRQLLTSQRDTEDLTLLSRGVTLRLRTTSMDGSLDNLGGVDICLKAPLDKNGGLARYEYEAEQAGFFSPDLQALRDKYPKDDRAGGGVHDYLDMVEGKDLIEYFRIDVLRERHIIKIPNNLVGLRDDQAFYGELLYDRIRYVIDEDGMDEPIVLNPHCELELEPLHKPCVWSNVPGAEAYVCQNLTDDDQIRCLDWFRDFVMNDRVHGDFEQVFKGKAERGFEALFSYADYISRHPQLLDKKLSSVFRSAGDGRASVPLTIVRPSDISQSDMPIAQRGSRPPTRG